MSLTNFDSVVVLSPYAWNLRDDIGGWQTTHHVAGEFARLKPTIFVESSAPWNIRADQFRVKRLFPSVAGARTYSPHDDLIVFRRRAVPFGRHPRIRNFDLRRNARALRTLLAEQGFRRPLLWHSFPYWSEPLIEAVQASFFAYHCLDYSPLEEETRLVKRADMVFCVSETLVEKFLPLNPHTRLLPNGVNLALFDRKRAAEQPRPAELPTRGRLLGFVGSINRHLDLELLVEVAEAFPDDHVLIGGRVLPNETAPVGRQKEALATLRTRPNVRFLGFVPTARLPLYFYTFDVCMIPFQNNEFNRECDPLKFYQYAAMGTPIVTTPVPVAERYPDLCYMGGTPGEFIQRVREALAEPKDAEVVPRRLEIAQAHGWPSLVARAFEQMAEVGPAPSAAVRRGGAPR